MDYPLIFLSITLINLMAWLSPGPNMMAVINASLTQGRTFGLLTGLGLSAGATLWAMLAVLGIESLFQHFPNLVFVLRLLGAGYLTFLGLKSLQGAYANKCTLVEFELQKQNKGKALLHGFLVSTSNPKAALFYGSILTTFVPDNAPSALLFSIVCLCSILAIIFHSITATLFSTELVARKFRKMQRGICATTGLVFSGLGLGVAIDTLRDKALS